VAKNLCSYAFDGATMKVDPEVERLVRAVARRGQAARLHLHRPVIAARLFGSDKVKLTIGLDAATAGHIRGLGSRHVDCAVDQIVVDPAAQGGEHARLHAGTWISPRWRPACDKLVGAVLEMA